MARNLQSDQESGLERICGIVALFFYSLLLVEGLGITIIVAVRDVAPRDAALVMVGPALLVWALASSRRVLRQGALSLFPPFF
jgi:hypothetical protein